MFQKGITGIEFIVFITVTVLVIAAINKHAHNKLSASSSPQMSRAEAIAKVKAQCQNACGSKGANLKKWEIKGSTSVACVCVKKEKDSSANASKRMTPPVTQLSR